jgi:sterol desaturase/sphingolipid hydroxylase (fatty acid hydroxylase superfamily)
MFVSRNYFLLHFIEYGTKHKPLIHEESIKNVPTYEYEFHMNVWRTTAIETMTHFYIESYIHVSTVTDPFYEIAYFIPLSFIFEIIFDFFHYFAHRLLHYGPIYKYAHKTHHKFKHPSAITTFYQDPVDLIITNSLPTVLALYMSPQITCLQYHLIIVYKSLVEISGHSGRQLYPTSSFTQFVWLPKSLGIELYTEDHDLHHSQNNCNFGKRFSLWDKIFGTYREPITIR